MGILSNLIWVILHMACVAAAKGPVDSINIAIGRLRQRVSQKQLSAKGELLIGLLVLLLGRLLLCQVARLL
jgi:hypothetical protein